MCYNNIVHPCWLIDFSLKASYRNIHATYITIVTATCMHLQMAHDERCLTTAVSEEPLRNCCCIHAGTLHWNARLHRKLPFSAACYINSSCAVANGYCKLWLCYCRASAVTVVVLLPAGSPVENYYRCLKTHKLNYIKPHNVQILYTVLFV